MADKSPVQVLCEEVTCPICLDYFKDPVIIECSHTFCQACIAECCQKAGSDASCPQCRESVQLKNFRPNRQLASIVEAAKKFSLHGLKEAEAPGHVCERHQEPLKFFCKDDQALICVVCDRSKEHREHEVIPKEEACEEYKGEVQTYLELLKKEREAILSSQQSGETEGQSLLKRTEAERKKILARFKQLRQFLEEQESRLLAKLKGLEDEIKDKRDAHISKLCEELSSVDLLIKEMEEKQKQPASEFLQDIRNILQRCNKKKFVNSSAFPPKFMQGIKKFSGLNSFLDSTMKGFKDTLLAGPQAEKGFDVCPASKPTPILKFVKRKPRRKTKGAVSTLHIPTIEIWNSDQKEVEELKLCFASDFTSKANDNQACTIPTLVLSKDCPSYYSPFQKFNQPVSQFSCWSYVMGTESITSGSCSWVINIKDENFWAVGVALEYFRGRSASLLSPEEGICAVGTSTDNKWYAFIPSGGHRIRAPGSASYIGAHYIGRLNIANIRVFLNYEQGSVTFTNTSNDSTLYIFHNVPFSGQPVSSWFSVGK